MTEEPVSTSSSGHDSHPDTADIEVTPVEDSGMKPMLITQVDYTTTTTRGETPEPVMHIFGRDAENIVHQVDVYGHEPYFYIPTEATEEPGFGSEEIVSVQPGYTSIRGRELSRVYTHIPKEVTRIRDDYEHYEADVVFPNRLMVDYELKDGMLIPDRGTHHTFDSPEEIEPCTPPTEAELRIHHVDIEVNDRNGFPEKGEEPILCFTTYDSYDESYIVWWCKENADQELDPDRKAELLTDQDAGTVSLRSYTDEAKMLDEYLDYVEETDPDLMTAWNIPFDMPYIVDRLKKLDATSMRNLSRDRLSRIDEVWGGRDVPNIKGRVVFDLLRAYKFTHFSEEESYRLEAIGQKVVGFGKETYTGKIGDLWEEDPDKLLEYSLQDVVLTVEIDKKTETIEYIDSQRRFVGSRIEDSIVANEVCDMYILHKARGRFVLPSKGSEDSEEYSGGAVFDAYSGIADMVAVLDLKSLYPMCMVSMNLSPETSVDPDVYEGDTYESPNGLHFRKEPDGIIREIVDELLGEREAKKSERDEHHPDSDAYKRLDRQQVAVKVVMNSLYGVLGWEQFRLYDKDMGAAVTATGRGVIQFTEEVVEDLGWEVTYGDTDSVMLELGKDVSKEEAIEIGFQLEKEINARYDEYAETLNADEHRFQIEFEKLYKRYFQGGKKKRYAGHITWKEGKDVDSVDITGFEYKRSDTPRFVKETQKEVLDMIVRGEEVDAIRDYIKDQVDKVKNEEVPLDEIGIPGGIGKKLEGYNPPNVHIKGAIYANLLLGTNLGKGSKPKRVYLERVLDQFYFKIERRRKWELERDDWYRQFKQEVASKDPKEGAICFEYPEEIPDDFIIDWDVQLDKTLKGPIERITEPLGLSWDDIITGTEQTGLGAWG
ncbi:DNA polymerase elongation subunit (plasmid) [Halorarum halophilum]|uniref:DNA polymerase n=1 Tax=Halorarum halophilum TaxID=2743090 RepID=A0A7D5KII9_9EURY|nr:DNA-directed DNA polymerase [Halobaculum halophilum]QLG30056.1 DNA polymerase elongation subunit [Halobaculum halophilum]